MAATAPMPSCLPPQLIIAWLPIRDVAAALGVSKDWCASPEPIFQAIAGRHGLQRVEPSWRETVRQYRSCLGHGAWLTLREPEQGQMDLIARVMMGNAPAIQSSINDGINPNFLDGGGETPLHVAATYGHLNALNALIAAGADINAQNRYVRGFPRPGTPLHAAVRSNSAPLAMRFACAARLIELGANARLLNADEEAPYQSKFGMHWGHSADGGGVRVETFRQFLKDAYRAQR